jgi:preprotein translocase subunit SecE
MKSSPAQFIREVKQEGRRISWPNRKETNTSVILVIALTIVFSLFFLLVDNIVSWGIKSLLGF